MRIAHIVPSLAERHGGPSKSVRGVANALAQSGLTVDLLTTGETGESLAHPSSEATRVISFPRLAPRRLCRSPGLNAHLHRETYDCIHHHSLWLLTLRYARAAAEQRGATFVISPRGMMSGWAYRHHRWRKCLAEALVHPGAFPAAAGWHATSPEEADDIRQLGWTQPVCVAPNGVVLPSPADLSTARDIWQALCPAVGHRPVALFYSRFHRKKRVSELIDLWLSVPRGDWLLLVVGVAEEDTAATLGARIAAAGAGEKVAVFDGAGRPPPYAVASLFLLPSRSENFGLVIAEALAAGVPALVTDATPWQGTAAEDCGWCVAWEDYPATLAAALAHSQDDLRAKGTRGRAWMERKFSWARAAALLQDFYRSLRHA